MDSRYIEMMDTAKIIAETCMCIKEGEQVLILTDHRYSECPGGSALQNAVIAAVNAMNAEVITMYMKARVDGHTQIPKIVAEAMKLADVVVTIPTEGLTHADETLEALMGGTRFVMLPCAGEIAPDDDIIYSMMPKSVAEVEELAVLTNKMSAIMQGEKEVRVVTELGTDLTVKIGKCKSFKSTGICDEPGTLEYVPTGQLAIGLDEGSANGVVVVDGSISPMGRPLKEPVTLTIQDGRIINVTGEGDAAIYKKLMEDVGNPEIYNVIELGFGMNPKAKISGNPLGDERLYGSAHIGFGNNLAFGGTIAAGNWHNDAIFSKATLYVNGEKIMENGTFLI